MASQDESAQTLPPKIETYVRTKAAAYAPRRKETKEVDPHQEQERQLNRLRLDYLERITSVRAFCEGIADEEVERVVSETFGKGKKEIWVHITHFNTLKRRDIEQERDIAQMREQIKGEAFDSMKVLYERIVDQMHIAAPSVPAAITDATKMQ